MRCVPCNYYVLPTRFGGQHVCVTVYLFKHCGEILFPGLTLQEGCPARTILCAMAVTFAPLLKILEVLLYSIVQNIDQIADFVYLLRVCQ